MPPGLARRSFTDADQSAFATLSGDRNPIHVDPVAARRTVAGRPVVHGVHTLLWALDAIAAAPDRPPVPTGLRADFMSFVPVGATIELGPLSDGEARRATVTDRGLAVAKLELRDRAAERNPSAMTGATFVAAAADPIAFDGADLHGLWGQLDDETDPAAVAARFPAACDWLGTARVRALLGCTRLVGMVCPGLHSVFNRLDATFLPAGASGRLDWCVAASDSRFRRVTLAVAADGVQASLFATVRQPPVAQSAVAALAEQVERGCFAGARALVVGGSRGLGELTAKVLAAGGAEVVVTYARGRDDAERVAAEIGGQGGTCSAVAYDVTAPSGAALAALPSGVSHAYYFATPTIFEAPRQVFDPERFGVFCQFYVQGFAALCEHLAAAGPASVFYPSTTFLDDPTRRTMVEYRMAKAAGEVLCDALGQTGLRIVRSRLPVLATDQTAALQAPAALDTLLPLIRAVQGAAQS